VIKCSVPECMTPITSKTDDGTGRHKVCPPFPNREEYLERKRRRMPRLCELQDLMTELGPEQEPGEALRRLGYKMEDEG
jgi:hypothetical protein